MPFWVRGTLAASGLIGKITQEFYKEFYKAQIFLFSPSLHLKMRLICAFSKQKNPEFFTPSPTTHISIHTSMDNVPLITINYLMVLCLRHCPNCSQTSSGHAQGVMETAKPLNPIPCRLGPSFPTFPRRNHSLSVFQVIFRLA